MRRSVVEQPPIKGRLSFVILRFVITERRAGDQRLNADDSGRSHGCFCGPHRQRKVDDCEFDPRLIEAPPQRFIDDVDIRDYPLAQLRSSIGYVPQETFLFSDSVKGNIAFGVENAEQAEVEWAAEIAGLSEDIRAFRIA